MAPDRPVDLPAIRVRRSDAPQALLWVPGVFGKCPLQRTVMNDRNCTRDTEYPRDWKGGGFKVSTCLNLIRNDRCWNRLEILTLPICFFECSSCIHIDHLRLWVDRREIKPTLVDWSGSKGLL